MNPPHAEDLEHLTALIRTSALRHTATDADWLLGSLEFERVAKWLTTHPNHTTAFAFLVQLLWSTAEELIEQRVEGGTATEFTDSVVAILEARVQ